MKRIAKLLVTVTVLLLTASMVLSQDTDTAKTYPPDVERALELAGDNRGEFEKLFEYFQRPQDTLKLYAAYFLVANMPGHGFSINELYDTSGTAVVLDVMAYPDYDSLIRVVESIEAERGELNYRRRELIEDLKISKGQELRGEVNYSVTTWTRRPWSKDISFDDFCNYMLPYRASNEPMERWRRTFIDRYSYIASEMKDTTDPIEAAQIINDDLICWFDFDERFYLHPTDQGVEEMIANKMGRCEDMANLAIFAMRSNGLAVTSDYTPYWANHSNNHAWNALVMPDGRAIPFMGCERNPGKYNLPYQMAKVYRKMFAKQPGTLGAIKDADIKVPRWLGGKTYRDVTSQYLDVSDPTIKLDPKPDRDTRYVYLTVFNSGDWKAIHWAEVDGEKATFTDMGRQIAYLPMYYSDSTLSPAAYPFVLDSTGEMNMLRPEENDKTQVALLATDPFHGEVAGKSHLTEGDEYELMYWHEDGEWCSLGKATATDGQPLTFDEVPLGALYWLVGVDSNRDDERIFTLENGVQVFW